MKRLWKLIMVILIIVMILFPILAPFISQFLIGAGFPALAAIVVKIGLLGYLVCGALGLGLAYALDPSTTSEIIHDAGELVGEVGAAAGNALSDTIGAFMGPTGWLLLGIGALWLLGKGKAQERESIPSTQDATPSSDAENEDAVLAATGAYNGR